MKFIKSRKINKNLRQIGENSERNMRMKFLKGMREIEKEEEEVGLEVSTGGLGWVSWVVFAGLGTWCLVVDEDNYFCNCRCSFSLFLFTQTYPLNLPFATTLLVNIRNFNAHFLLVLYCFIFNPSRLSQIP